MDAMGTTAAGEKSAPRCLGVVFETATPFDTPRLMAELAHGRRRLEAKNLHALIVIAVLVVVLLAARPFRDGNGRLSRVLMALLLRAGYAYVPHCSLESAIEQSKDAYHLALRSTQVTIRTEASDRQPWLVFFLRPLQQQKAWRGKNIERARLILGDRHRSARRVARRGAWYGLAQMKPAARRRAAQHRLRGAGKQPERHKLGGK